MKGKSEIYSKITNLKEMLKRSAKLYNNKILYRNEKITYKDFEEKVNNLGTALIQMGLKNKKIAIISENRCEWEITFFSIVCGTGIIVPIDKNLPKEEIENIVNKAKIEAIFCSKKYEKTLKEIKNKYSFLKYIISFDLSDKTSFTNLILKGQKLIEEGNSSFINAKIGDEDVCSIIFTSGTTKDAKTVMLSHKNICSSAVNVSKVMDVDKNDIALSVLPLNHVLEGLFCFLLSIYTGMERVFCNELDQIIDYIKEYKITYMGAVPLVYEYLYKRKDELKKEASHIKVFMSGGASLKTKIVKDYKNIGINLIQGYGLTECAPVVSMQNKKEDREGSVGKVIPNLNIKLDNRDKQGIGEIIVKGDNVFKGYFQDEKSTKESLIDGWFYTGDLAKIDEDGYIYICGRTKNVIVMKNGKKVFPEEIETLLNKISGVKEALIFENSNKIYAKIVYNKEKFKSEEPLKIKESLMEKIKKLNERLPQYKRINNIFITETELEKTLTGKLKRNGKNLKIVEKEVSKKKVEETSKSKLKKDGKRVRLAENSKGNKLGKSNKEDKLERLKRIFTKQLGPCKIDEKSNIITDLGADSLDIVEIFLEIEKEFKIKIDKEKRAKIKTIKDIEKMIKK